MVIKLTNMMRKRTVPIIFLFSLLFGCSSPDESAQLLYTQAFETYKNTKVAQKDYDAWVERHKKLQQQMDDIVKRYPSSQLANKIVSDSVLIFGNSMSELQFYYDKLIKFQSLRGQPEEMLEFFWSKKNQKLSSSDRYFIALQTIEKMIELNKIEDARTLYEQYDWQNINLSLADDYISIVTRLSINLNKKQLVEQYVKKAEKTDFEKGGFYLTDLTLKMVDEDLYDFNSPIVQHVLQSRYSRNKLMKYCLFEKHESCFRDTIRGLKEKSKYTDDLESDVKIYLVIAEIYFEDTFLYPDPNSKFDSNSTREETLHESIRRIYNYENNSDNKMFTTKFLDNYCDSNTFVSEVDLETIPNTLAKLKSEIPIWENCKSSLVEMLKADVIDDSPISYRFIDILVRLDEKGEAQRVYPYYIKNQRINALDSLKTMLLLERFDDINSLLLNNKFFNANVDDLLIYANANRHSSSVGINKIMNTIALKLIGMPEEIPW